MKEHEFSSCVSQIKAGEMDGLKAIYEAYHAMIFYCILDLVKNRETAEDLAADFFVKLWNTAEKYKGPTHKKWMLTIAKNMTIDYLRKYGKETSGDAETIAETVASPEPAVSEQATDKVAVRAAMQVLSAEERQVIDMKIVGEMTFAEIAETLSVPQGTVSWRYREGIKKLRCALGN